MVTDSLIFHNFNTPLASQLSDCLLCYNTLPFPFRTTDTTIMRPLLVLLCVVFVDSRSLVDPQFDYQNYDVEKRHKAQSELPALEALQKLDDVFDPARKFDESDRDFDPHYYHPALHQDDEFSAPQKIDNLEYLKEPEFDAPRPLNKPEHKFDAPEPLNKPEHKFDVPKPLNKPEHNRCPKTSKQT